jgi:hypothetical protein
VSTEDHDEQDGRALLAEGESFAGLADLDEDLRTMSQSNAEVERWRRLSTRGRESERPGANLDAPIVDPELAAEAGRQDVHAATTAPGTIEAPLGAFAEPAAPRADAARTQKLPSIPPEALAEASRATRKSFAPPRDAPSAPPGSRIALPVEHPPELLDGAAAGAPASRPPSGPPPLRASSRPPPRVPRPRPPRAEASAEGQGEARGWRASDPAPAPHAGGSTVPGSAGVSGAAAGPLAESARASARPAPRPSSVPPPAGAPDEVTVQPWVVRATLAGILLLASLALWWVFR